MLGCVSLCVMGLGSGLGLGLGFALTLTQWGARRMKLVRWVSLCALGVSLCVTWGHQPSRTAACE